MLPMTVVSVIRGTHQRLNTEQNRKVVGLSCFSVPVASDKPPRPRACWIRHYIMYIVIM